MGRDALVRLVTDANRLPGSPDPERVGPLPLRGPDRRQLQRPRGRHAEAELDPQALQARLHELLVELAHRVDDKLSGTLERAHAWDQVDALRFADAALHVELGALKAAALALKADPSPEVAALALEAQLTLDAVLGLVSLFERRLATLVRLRLRAGDDPDQRTLLPGGRPFLDLGAALHETARRWA